MPKIVYFILPLFCELLFASSAEEIYTKAKELEKAGDFQRAMLLYKKSAALSLKMDNKKIYKNNKNISLDKNGKISSKVIEAYKVNYIMPIAYNSVFHKGRKRVETKFQISFKKKLESNFLSLGGSLYGAYTQKSFWQIAEKSSPFRETNYAPEFFVLFPYLKHNSYLKYYKIGLLHESNGRGGLYSRSWNRVYLKGVYKYKNFTFSPKIWYRIPEKKKSSPLDAKGDDNPDILNYLGYGNLTVSYMYKKNKFSLLLRDNLKIHNNKGAVKFFWTFPLIKNGVFGYMQMFTGYGESLIDYNKRNTKLGLGFAITR